MLPKFNVSDYIVSNSYPGTLVGISPTKIQERNLFLLHTTILEPFFNNPATRDNTQCVVLSGLRSLELNELVGGSVNSDHLYGNAIDITAGPNMWDFRLFSFLKKHSFIYGQLIAYLKKDLCINFIHVSLPTKKYHREIRLKFHNKKKSEPFKCMTQIRF